MSSNIENTKLTKDSQQFISKTADAKKKPVITPAQFAALKTGKRVNILLSTKGDTFIAIEGAYAALLCQYWALAKNQLADTAATTIHLEEGNKAAVKWVYGYMLAGEKEQDPNVKLGTMAISKLLDMYQYATYLGYKNLKEQVHSTLQSRLNEYLSALGDVDKILELIPDLHKEMLKELINLFTRPLIFDYGKYADHVEKHAGEDLREVLDKQVAAGNKYHSSKPHAKHNKPVVCYNCKEEGHVARSCKAPKAIPKPKICYKCKTKGHLARDCTERAPKKQCFICGSVRHVAKTCPEPYMVPTPSNGKIRTSNRVAYPGELTRTGIRI